MLINTHKSKRKQRFIFLSNTKTASTSIESILRKHCNITLDRPPSVKHMSYRKICKNFNFLFSKPGFEIDTFYKFGVIREPIDWVISWFNYRSRQEIADPQHKQHKNYLGNTNFEEYIDLLDKGLLAPQSNLFLDKNGKDAMNFIIRYENLEEDFNYVMKQIGLKEELTIPHKNKSNNVRIRREDISQKNLKKIQSIFYKDYQFIESKTHYKKAVI